MPAWKFELLRVLRIK